jgi:hypothetical protein
LATFGPGAVTTASSNEAKLELCWLLFAARRDVYARGWPGLRPQSLTSLCPMPSVLPSPRTCGFAWRT